jgi:hypothetical protein
MSYFVVNEWGGAASWCIPSELEAPRPYHILRLKAEALRLRRDEFLCAVHCAANNCLMRES